MCGFYWLMEQLRAWGVFSGVLALWLPDGMGGGWSGAPAEAWRTAGPWTELTREQISAGAAKWRALQSENAPLRANVRGKLQSVSEDFYDGWLERAIDAQEECFQEARLIGTILGQYRLEMCIRDRLYASASEAHKRLRERLLSLIHISLIKSMKKTAL